MFALGPLNLPITANYSNLAKADNASLTGVSALGVVNSLTVTASIALTGLSAQGLTGTILVWGLVPPGPDANWTLVPAAPSGGWTQVVT